MYYITCLVALDTMNFETTNPGRDQMIKFPPILNISYQVTNTYPLLSYSPVPKPHICLSYVLYVF